MPTIINRVFYPNEAEPLWVIDERDDGSRILHIERETWNVLSQPLGESDGRLQPLRMGNIPDIEV